MPDRDTFQDAAEPSRRRLFVYNGGFLTQTRIRRILELSGFDITIGLPKAPQDLVGVWGQSPTSPRGEAIAAKTGHKVVRIEDAFLRSVLPARLGKEPPLGLHVDETGLHFDPETPSDLETLLKTHPLDDTQLLDRARAGIDRLRRGHLSKYNGHDPEAEIPAAGYVLVVDQTKGDASVTASRANRNTFREMLFDAREAYPGAKILIKSHPETLGGARDGYLRAEDCDANTELFDRNVAPQALLEGAIAVYTVSSQLGFEAILAGHKPHVYGQPFYSGWGLTQDRVPLARRRRRLTRAQLFAAAMILYPVWYDPHHDRLCTFEEALNTLEAEVRAWREDHRGWVATHMRLWKRQPLQRFFGSAEPIRFARPSNAAAKAERHGARLMCWAGKITEDLAAAGAIRVEDGFLRSRGLGAALTPPLSLALDDLGIYYDPNQPSRLEHLIEASVTLPDHARQRAAALLRAITKSNLSKYNLGGAALPAGLPAGRRILVPGQVEDDASILLGTQGVRTNQELLKAARRANPAAVILYKPHPDVEAGLRQGHVPEPETLADAVLTATDPIAALSGVDEVWTMTSTLGFEALLRGKSVTCLGQPFYSGWGLTDDRAMPIARRGARPDLIGLVHAVLIDYPRYFDPLTGRPCPPEIAVSRLAQGDLHPSTFTNRLLSKLQGGWATAAALWR